MLDAGCWVLDARGNEQTGGHSIECFMREPQRITQRQNELVHRVSECESDSSDSGKDDVLSSFALV
jgi:hypothetical protein